MNFSLTPIIPRCYIEDWDDVSTFVVRIDGIKTCLFESGLLECRSVFYYEN